MDLASNTASCAGFSHIAYTYSMLINLC